MKSSDSHLTELQAALEHAETKLRNAVGDLDTMQDTAVIFGGDEVAFLAEFTNELSGTITIGDTIFEFHLSVNAHRDGDITFWTRSDTDITLSNSIDCRMFYNLMYDLDAGCRLILSPEYGERVPKIHVRGAIKTVKLSQLDSRLLRETLDNLVTTCGNLSRRSTSDPDDPAFDHWEADRVMY